MTRDGYSPIYRAPAASGTWRGLSPDARADLFASDYLRTRTKPDDEPSGLEAVQELFQVRFDDRELAAIRAITITTFIAATERESALEIAVDAERRLRLRYERALLDRGIPLPTLTD